MAPSLRLQVQAAAAVAASDAAAVASAWEAPSVAPEGHCCSRTSGLLLLSAAEHRPYYTPEGAPWATGTAAFKLNPMSAGTGGYMICLAHGHKGGEFQSRVLQMPVRCPRGYLQSRERCTLILTERCKLRCNIMLTGYLQYVPDKNINR